MNDVSIVPEWFATLGPMGWPLLGCSVVLTAVLLRRLFASFSDSLAADSIADRIWSSTVEGHDHSKELREDKLEAAMEPYEHSAYSGMSTLKAVAAISPMVGLLGTMIGIMASFRNIAESEGPVTPSLIAEGLWQAMSTTAFGIALAIIALAAGFLFNRKAEGFTRDLARNLNERGLKLDEQREQKRMRSPVSGAQMERWDGAQDKT